MLYISVRIKRALNKHIYYNTQVIWQKGLESILVFDSSSIKFALIAQICFIAFINLKSCFLFTKWIKDRQSREALLASESHH